jgi:hypothetical protein
MYRYKYGNHITQHIDSRLFLSYPHLHRKVFSTVPLLLNEGSFLKASAPPLFLEDENFFQKSATLVPREIRFPMYQRGRFLKKVLIFEKKGGVLISPPGFVWWVLYKFNLHTNLKIRMVISGIATSKNHIELLVPGQIWDRICDPGQILV